MRHQSIFLLYQLHPVGNYPKYLLNGDSNCSAQLFPELTAKCAGAIMGGGVKISGYWPSHVVLLSFLIKQILRPISEVKDPYGILYLALFRTFILVAFATGMPIAGASLKRTDPKN